MASAIAGQVLEFPRVARESEVHISLAEILSALSFALDLAEDAVPGHALRSCLLGMRIAKEFGLPTERMVTLYYSLLLKDVGCSSNAARLCEIIGGGDERRMKAGVRLEDWTRRASASPSILRVLWNTVHPDAGPAKRAAGIVRIGLAQQRNQAEIIALRSGHGSQILRKLGLSNEAAEAVRCLDEHWDGSGYPEHRTGIEIPLEARILAIAQHLDAYATEHGTLRAMQVLHERSGRWFDPKLVWVAEWLHCKGMLWTGALSDTPQRETRARVLDLAPEDINRLEASDIDLICEAFAEVVDAKSSFTFRHSLGVTATAVSIAREMGLSDDRVRLVNRAALLHDLGKLRVPNSILDKPSGLASGEWSVVHEHPRLTRRILSHIGAFGELAAIAGAHHERLDGTGYPDRLSAERIPIEARIIAVADVYGALTEDRPYRPAMAPEEAMEILAREVPDRLDPYCCDALFAAISQGQA